VTGIGRGDGAMVISCFDFCCSQLIVEDKRAVGSKPSDVRLGSYNEFYWIFNRGLIKKLLRDILEGQDHWENPIVYHEIFVLSRFLIYDLSFEEEKKNNNEINSLNK
jgi:hypothetical protein